MNQGSGHRSSRTPDVLIAGAGPAGSSAAWHLARAGLRVVLVDRAAFPREKACSEYLSPEAVRLLDELGVVGDLEAAGAMPLLGTRVIGPRGSQLTGCFSRTTPRPWRETGLSVPRRLLDHRLVEAAITAGAELRERAHVEDLLYEGGAVAGAVIRDLAGRRTTVHARLVIGADGLRSVVARRLAGGARRPAARPARLAFVAHVAGVAGLDGFAEMHVGDAGYVGLNRIGADLANVALVVPQRRAGAARGRVEDFFFHALEQFPGVRGRVDRRQVTRRVLATGPFAAWARPVVTDGALLVGDAAEFFDPFTGEGIASALRSARLAAHTARVPLLTGRPVTAAGLAGYRAARRAAFLGKWTIERLVGYGMFVPALFDRAISRLERRGLAHTFIGVTGDHVPAGAVLNPWFLARMML